MKPARVFIILVVFLALLFIKSSDSLAVTFGPNLLVSDADPFSSSSGEGPPIIEVDIAKSIYVAWIDHRNILAEVFFSKLTSDGTNFSANKSLTGILGPSDTRFFPQIEEDNGNIYISWWERRIVDGITKRGIFFTKSTDGGETFSEEVLIDRNDGLPFSMVAHDGKIYVAYSVTKEIIFNTFSEIWVASSSDNGNTFTKSKVTDVILMNKYAQRPVVDFRGNDVYVFWLDPREGGPKVFFAKSTDGGSTFGQNRAIFSHPNTGIGLLGNSFGRLSTEVFSSGTVFLAFDFFLVTQNPFTTDYEVYFTKSTDGGNSFSPTRRLADDDPNLKKEQQTPSLTLLPDGSPVVSWNDCNGGCGQVKLSYSQDQGETFSPNIRINNTALNRAFGQSIVADREGKIHFVRFDGALSPSGMWYTEIDLGLDFEVPPIPFLDLPWDYQAQGKSFDQVAFNPNSWFDHKYPLQNIPCCIEQVMKYTGETEKDFYRSHNGYDYGSQTGVLNGTPVHAAASGWATFTSWQNSSGAGNVIKIDHGNGYQTWYEHLSGNDLVISQEGQKVFVNQGQVIAKVGMTGNTNGPHIHFSVFKDTDDDQSFADEIPFGVTDPLGWEGESGQDPWPRDLDGTQSHNLFIVREQPKTANIPTTGGSISNNKITVNIPEGASSAQIKVNLKNGPFESITDFITSVVPSFFLSAFDNNDQPVTQFSQPVTVSYDYSGADLSNIDEDSLKLYVFNEQTFNWEELPTILDKINKIASAQTLHFSQFALMGEVKDLIAPATQVTLTGEKGQDNWYRSDVTVELDGQDNDGGIGLQYTLYTLNDNDWLEYEEPLIFDHEGSYKITYQSYDKAENTEERKIVEFHIDKTPPDVSVDTNPKYLWPPNGKMVDVNVTGNSSDTNLYSTSFIVEDEYNLVEPLISNFGQIIQLEARREGSDLDGRAYIIKVVAEDLAGNKTEGEVKVIVPHDQRKKE